jgi:uncharacterized membrane protein HdeD (DUF308 family)
MTATHPADEGAPSGPRLSEEMSALLARNWWALLLRGLIGVVLGALTLLMPAVSLASLVLLFAIYMIVDGVLGIVAAVRAARRQERWGWLILEGVFDIGAGIVALLWPGITVLVFVILVAAWAIVSGASMAIAAFRLDRRGARWLMALAGVLSVIWGVLLAIWPISGALVLTLWIGAYALVFGITLIVLAFRLRSRRPA